MNIQGAYSNHAEVHHISTCILAGQLTQVTLFDQQYVVVRRPAVTHADGSVSGGSPAVLLDRCPHRAAALSQVCLLRFSMETPAPCYGAVAGATPAVQSHDHIRELNLEQHPRVLLDRCLHRAAAQPQVCFCSPWKP